MLSNAAPKKIGTGTLTFTGANTYTGVTTVAGGALELGPSAQNCVFNLGGADIQSGKMVFDYAGGSSPAATIQGLLNASYDGGLWDVGQFRDSTVATTGLTLGWLDNESSAVTVMATYPGDFNLDGVVNSADLDIWFANAGDGHDLAAGRCELRRRGQRAGSRPVVRQHVGLPPLVVPRSRPAARVPEPGTLALLAAGLIGLLAYGWRKRN